MVILLSSDAFFGKNKIGRQTSPKIQFFWKVTLYTHQTDEESVFTNSSRVFFSQNKALLVLPDRGVGEIGPSITCSSLWPAVSNSLQIFLDLSTVDSLFTRNNAIISVCVREDEKAHEKATPTSPTRLKPNGRVSFTVRKRRFNNFHAAEEAV